MSYERIAPLPTDSAELASSELRALQQVWGERRGALESGGKLDRFLLRLRREWAIETGIIERLYSWDRGVTEVLIEQGIDAAIIAHRARLPRDEAEQVGLLIHDQQEVIEALFAVVRGDQPVSNHFIRGLHATFTAHQDTTDAVDDQGRRVRIPLLRGEYKRRSNNPRRPDGSTHEYCPPDLVDEQMEHLVTRFRDYDANVSAAPEVLAAWLHHRFTQIHPFQDGNGRVARALASLVLLRAGMFPLTVRDRERTAYIEALESADRGDLLELVQLFARRQRDAIMAAISADAEVRRETAIDAILASATRTLESKREERYEAFSAVFETGDALKEHAEGRLAELRERVSEAIRPLSVPGKPVYDAWRESSKSETAYYYRSQIIGVAHELGYYANFDTYQEWVRLCIQTRDQFNLVVSFHGAGRAFQGILVASAFSYRVAESGDGLDRVELHSASIEPFQFNYAESSEGSVERFESWLEACAAIALERWRRTLE